jgi:hypothetical protein
MLSQMDNLTQYPIRSNGYDARFRAEFIGWPLDNASHLVCTTVCGKSVPGGEPTDRPARQLSAEQRRALVLAALSGEGPVALARCRDTSDYRTWKPKDKALGDAQEQAECRWRMWGLEAVGEATM